MGMPEPLRVGPPGYITIFLHPIATIYRGYNTAVRIPNTTCVTLIVVMTIVIPQMPVVIAVYLYL